MRRLAIVSVAALVLATLSAGPAQATHPGADGLIAFDQFLDSHIGAILANGSGGITLIQAPDVREPAWSPNGMKIAFLQRRHLVVANADGSNPTTIFTTNRWIVSPSWSPTGTSIAVEASLPGLRAGRVTIIGADGTGVRRIGPKLAARTSSGGGLDWSPTGTIAFVSGRFGPRLHTIQPFGAHHRLIPGVYYFAPSWSPNGSRLAVTRATGGGVGRTDIVTMNPDGSRRRNLTSTPQRWEWTPAWSPDGARIAFSRSYTSSDQSTDDIWVMRSDGSGVHRIARTPTVDEFDLDWQPT